MKKLLLVAMFIPVVALTLVEGQAPSKLQNITETLPGGVKLEMVAIPGGSFLMGSDKVGWARPVHKVTIKPFYMGRYEVTEAQWRAVMGKGENPYLKFQGDSFPIEDVGPNHAREFCKKLSQMTGKEYRLPSEAEWEYAARAGSTGDYCFGDDINLFDMGSDKHEFRQNFP